MKVSRCRRCLRHMVSQRQTLPQGWAHHRGRGLCNGCHAHVARHGQLDDYERVTRSREDLLEDFRLLCGRGLSVVDAAHQMGITTDAIYAARVRERAAVERLMQPDEQLGGAA
jgi:hypothetical protein